jgi:chromosome segregation ATPase
MLEDLYLKASIYISFFVLTRLQRKRARLSRPPSCSSRDSSATLSGLEETSPSENPNQDLPPSTQYEIDRDAGFAHLEHPELDDARVMHRLVKRHEQLGENHAAENGIIESVAMTNFMCHDRLHVTLGPLLNFITGKNGSGKSAILTAITLCLGGKASTTNRGGSLQSFIKEGRDYASLVIHLKNQGADAYQPDVYGQKIIVERNFSKTGTSGYKLKNAAGRLISNKKADVEEIIEYFQMQIDNPMSVLNQDNARQFLSTSTPAEKYRFFVKGIQLEQLDDDYRLVSETADLIKFKLDENKNLVDKLKAGEDRAKEKIDFVEKHSGMQNNAQKLREQLAWALVGNEERELREQESKVTEAQDRIALAEQVSELNDLSCQQTGDAAERAAGTIQTVINELAPLKEEEAEAKATFDSADQELKNIRLEHRQIRDHLVGAKRKVADIQKDIAAEQQRVESANGGGHAKKLADLDAAQRRVAEAKLKLEESASEKLGLDEQCKSVVRDFEKSKFPLAKKHEEIMNHNVGQAMASFDSKIPRLLTTIRDDPSFKEKPIGPIGLHIKLLKPIWSNVLEKSIGNVLNGFIVTSKADQLRLSKMMEQLNLDFCPVIIGNRYSIDMTGHEPDTQYDTVLRVLEIDNDLVRNQLIITQGIEQTILVERREDAMKILFEGTKPQNVRQCFCLHDNQRGWGLRLGYMRGLGNQAISPIAPTGRKPRMKTNAESQLAYQKDTLEHLQRELHELERSHQELQDAIAHHTHILKRHDSTHKGIQIQLQRAEDAVERLQDELDRDHIEDGRLEALKEDLREAEGEMDLHCGSYSEATMAMENQGKICRVYKQALDSAKERIIAYEAKIKKAEGKLRRFQQDHQIALQEKLIAIDAVNEAERVKETLEQKRDRQANTVADLIRQAQQVGPRIMVYPNDTPRSIEAKLEKITAQLKTYSQVAGGTDEEIRRAYAAAVEAHRAASGQLGSLLELHKLLKESLEDRLDRWRKFQRFTSARSRINFTYLLSERGFRGELFLDHENKLLEIQVEPDETTMNSTGRATKTLSSGEKSFSSACLLLSVWEAMGSPLKCLDEFDVFMDHVNRDICTNMIVG